ncbi:protein HEXIM1 [Micropterus salmoides]|uniref:protein HEXIM1 n=1 Tax=Micropterus salmoides TaxID=27706 RepID=UPI0018EA9909|nr:protein HEXIM1 [Micropterus salmoides]XP_045899160.1 protein HEXIM1 [Micropterus dolomieu]
MTEPAEQTHHLKTSGSPSGGSSGDASEHLPASNRGGPENGDRGRQRDQKRQQRAGNCGDINTDKLWQMKGGQRGVCPAFAAGNELPKCPIAARSHQKSDVQAAGDGGPPSQGKNGEDRPLGETLNLKEESLLIDSDTGFDTRLGRKRHRRRNSKKKRSWKPYYKLSWEERKALEEKETARASRLREEMFAKGLPVAPYNTTQFLMDEHDREEPDLNTETGVRRPSGVGGRMEDTGSEEEFFDNEEDDDDDGSGGGSDGIGRPGNAGGEFLQRDFSETYEMYHVESLQNMTKQELVQEYLELEKCMSRLEEENNRLRRAVEPGGLTVESSLVRLGELERELERLRAQNTELLLQNQPSKDRSQVATN